MKSLWNNKDADKLGNDPLKLRVYSSRLLGQEEDLVLHGGGNTSVKTKETNIFGEEEDILYVKGSGWDLATIEEAGFAPVKLDALRRSAQLDRLSDVEMVKFQRIAMTDPSAPNPSVEAILHALIPFAFVDHTHADAVVTISNSPYGKERIENIYGDSMLIVPYVMPGFVLAKEIHSSTQNINWDKIQGMILLNHGIFTFHNDAKVSYERMIEAVTKAEDHLLKNAPKALEGSKNGKIDPLKIAQLRQDVSRLWGKPILAHQDNSPLSAAFSQLPDLGAVLNRGPLTPDHIIRTKRVPLVLAQDHAADFKNFAREYEAYFAEFSTGDHIPLDSAPRWAVWPEHGVLSFGPSMKENIIIHDIAQHTMKAIFRAEQIGGWQTLSKGDLFEMEYWTLEQEKLKKDPAPKPMQGKVCLVTGAASGIGKSCVERLVREGAVVSALDIDPTINSCFDQNEILGITCDITDKRQLDRALEKTIAHFGGLDMLVSNAGIFPNSSFIEKMEDNTWNKSMDINLTSHMQLLKSCLPYLSLGIDPAIVLMGSKNVAAPGPGAAAYSVAKAGLTQLGRVAALEFGEKGIRVNILHPNAVFDTGIWTDEILEARAGHYGLSVEEYKTNNILKEEVTSRDVAELTVQMLGEAFSKTTGAQVPIDGGNVRTI